MKKWWINAACIAVMGAVTVFALGCGDDKSNNGGNSGLTEEEQYQLTQDLMAFAPDLILQNFGSQFWDGVDAEDFDFNLLGLGKVMPPRLGKVVPNALSRSVQLETDSLYYAYGNGWWKFHVEYSLDLDTNDISLGVTLLLNDSVRFETEAGTPQIDPNANTHRFRHEGSVGLIIALDADTAGSLALDIGGDNGFTVVGLNESQVEINGSSSADIEFETNDAVVDGDTVDAFIAISFDSEVEDVITDNVAESCPDDGTMTLQFGMDFDVTNGDEHVEASGDWEVHVDLLGGGEAHIEVHSGDFEAEGDDTICEPPVE